MQNLYIALIDDDEDDVFLLKECFKKYDSIHIRDFSNGQKFLDESFDNGFPCLMVIDLNLPDYRGVHLIDKIKENSLLANVPMLVYTTAYSRSEQVTCEEMKIRLLKKPATVIEWEEIADMMAKHCL